MARVTVEDCLDKVPNRFELVRMASRRARLLERGEVQPMRQVARDSDKHTVTALKEIAEGLIDNELLDQQEAESEISGF